MVVMLKRESNDLHQLTQSNSTKGNNFGYNVKVTYYPYIYCYTTHSLRLLYARVNIDRTIIDFDRKKGNKHITFQKCETCYLFASVFPFWLGVLVWAGRGMADDWESSVSLSSTKRVTDSFPFVSGRESFVSSRTLHGDLGDW